MCGIWAILSADYEEDKCKPEFLKIAGRGPDLTVISKVTPNCWLGFHRLAIIQVNFSHIVKIIHEHFLILDEQNFR